MGVRSHLVRRQSSTCYAVGGTPLAFTQENFLVFTVNLLCAGVLANLDGYMNIALEQTEEYVNGQLKNKYGDAFIRGNNGK